LYNYNVSFTAAVRNMTVISGFYRFPLRKRARWAKLYRFVYVHFPLVKVVTCRRGWSGKIASLTHGKFFLFFLSSSRPPVALWTHIHEQYVIIRRSSQGSTFFGVIKMKSETWPISPAKT